MSSNRLMEVWIEAGFKPERALAGIEDMRGKVISAADRMGSEIAQRMFDPNRIKNRIAAAMEEVSRAGREAKFSMNLNKITGIEESDRAMTGLIERTKVLRAELKAIENAKSGVLQKLGMSPGTASFQAGRSSAAIYGPFSAGQQEDAAMLRALEQQQAHHNAALAELSGQRIRIHQHQVQLDAQLAKEEFGTMMAQFAREETSYEAHMERLERISARRAGLGGMGGGARNRSGLGGMMALQASYGAQDFITVLASGGHFQQAIVGASNNLGFLLSMIGGVKGALLGLGITIAALAIEPLIKYFTRGKEAVNDFGDSVRSVGKDMDRLQNAISGAESGSKFGADLARGGKIDTIKDLESALAGKRGEAGTLEARMGVRGNAIAELEEKLRLAQPNGRSLTAGRGPNFMSPEAQKEAQEQLNRLRREQDADRDARGQISGEIGMAEGSRGRILADETRAKHATESTRQYKEQLRIEKELNRESASGNQYEDRRNKINAEHGDRLKEIRNLGHLSESTRNRLAAHATGNAERGLAEVDRDQARAGRQMGLSLEHQMKGTEHVFSIYSQFEEHLKRIDELGLGAGQSGHLKKLAKETALSQLSAVKRQNKVHPHPDFTAIGDVSKKIQLELMGSEDKQEQKAIRKNTENAANWLQQILEKIDPTARAG